MYYGLINNCKGGDKMKFFVLSDIHGFYDEMIKALNEAGFDPDNEEHWLITCGDHFDRGEQPLQVMEYLQGLKRKTLVRGNHEYLLEDCCHRGYYEMYDHSNGTLGTILRLGRGDLGNTFEECCKKTLNVTREFRNSMVNYFETKNYIFVHSWIPLRCKDNLPMHYTKNRKFEFDPDWRNANDGDWETARWGNPFEMAANGFLPDKTIVFGHWHTSYGHSIKNGTFSEWGKDADFSPYYGEGYIGIDACCGYTGKINVIVLEDEFLDG
jgi:hypothetical protein